jgi:hypothetical protein
MDGPTHFPLARNFGTFVGAFVGRRKRSSSGFQSWEGGWVSPNAPFVPDLTEFVFLVACTFRLMSAGRVRGVVEKVCASTYRSKRCSFCTYF